MSQMPWGQIYMQNTSHSYTLEYHEYHVLYVMSYLLYIWSDPTVWHITLD